MSKRRILILALLPVMLGAYGCAYRHYLGMHGPSIWRSPGIHDASMVADAQCLACHGPGSSGEAPATTHPTFKGCLKCHNDR